MKKALKMILLYLFFLIIGITIGTVLYSIYLNVINSVAGTDINLFDFSVIRKAFFYISACIIICISPVVSFVHIRKGSGVSMLVTYIILSFVLWGIALPTVIHFGRQYDFNNPKTKVSDVAFSADYFRKGNDKVYYFYDDIDNSFIQKEVPATVIDVTQYGKVEYKPVVNSSTFELNTNAKPYRDITIKESFGNTKITSFINFHVIISRVENALLHGKTYFLAFLSFGLLLCTLYGISKFFDWKLMDVGVILAVTLTILFVNSYCTVYPLFASLIEKINSKRLFVFLSNYMDEPFIVLSNIIFSILLIVLGIINFVSRKKKLNK